MVLLRIYLIAAAAFGIDRLSKVWIVHWLDLETLRVIEVWPPFLTFIMGWNTGINFGLFDNGGEAGRIFLIVLSLAICAALTWWGRRARGWAMPLGIGLVIGGAIGNVVDRIIYRAVADYLNVSCCGIVNPFTFNVADVFIFGGAALLVIFGDRQEDRA